MDDEIYDLVDAPEDDPHNFNPLELADAPPVSIDYDLSCRRCAYNLRGLSEDSACPECGTAVGRSLLGDQLRFSDPVWVRTLASGMTWIVWGIFLGILLGVLIMIVEFALPNTDPLTLSLIGSVPSLVALVGYWRVTAPEPDVMEVKALTLRSFVRWTMVPSAVINLVVLFGIYIDPLIAHSIGVLGSLIGLAGYLALFVYARRLALRVPDEGLAHQTRVVMWGTVISLGTLMVSIAIIALTATSTASPTPSLVAAVPLCMAGIAYLVFAIWSLVLIVRYQRAASAAADSAERTWAQGM